MKVKKKPYVSYAELSALWLYKECLRSNATLIQKSVERRLLKFSNRTRRPDEDDALAHTEPVALDRLPC